MQTKFGFTLMDTGEFESYISDLMVARTIVTLQQHHTYSPNYALFTGDNHFELQRGMRNYHVNSNGWNDIGQHFTIFPDGTVMTGRSIEKSPACIVGQNSNAICIENLGNFDTGGDAMRKEQASAIISATAVICLKFNIPVTTERVVYHHWFRLSDGVRNNGSGGNKSCPGTAFFGGNKVADCESNFLPLVEKVLGGQTNINSNIILKYVSVTARSLNIRTKPDSSSEKAPDRAPATLGAILRVYKIRNGWYKISGSQNHWVAANYTKDVYRATVNADVLNVRNQPSARALKVSELREGEEAFIYEERDGWCRISPEQKWVNKTFLTTT
ncbi:MAG: N-acetylmuramoyl-L-alanine amidase [Chitinophagaceae bacterium]|nr:N-acetylmuramoyl-L-alanine amidase [Chitinophagaceae bacterium]MCW5929762.1 N-acetylmuramoyl-L-alanine amidase [Chitinophagaceae bacterium]